MHPVDLLLNDHRTVQALFTRYGNARDNKDRVRVFAEIKRELDAHAAVEEEIFYPAIKRAQASPMVDESYEEHGLAKTLLRELSTSRPGRNRYEAKMGVLRRLVEQHMAVEEGAMLPWARTALDAATATRLGARMARHKARLLGVTPTSVMTVVAEAMQAAVQRGQGAMDKATTGLRRSVAASSSRRGGRAAAGVAALAGAAAAAGAATRRRRAATGSRTASSRRRTGGASSGARGKTASRRASR